MKFRNGETCHINEIESADFRNIIKKNKRVKRGRHTFDLVGEIVQISRIGKVNRHR